MSASQLDPKDFYNDNDPEISDQTRAILTKNGIPEDQLVSHIRAVRDKGWAQVKFPCIGFYAFLEFSIGKAMHYDDILARLKNGDTLLDMGCCFGQDIRKLVYDGAPANNLTGTELDPIFIDLGYELFQDKQSLSSHFVSGDIFAEGKPYGLEDGSFDFVHAGSFFHQFTWDEQVEAVTKCLRLLKPKAGGSMLIGRHIAAETPGIIKHSQLRNGEAYHHDVESWKKLVAEAAEQARLQVKVETELVEVNRSKSDRKWKMMRFCIVLR